MARFFQIKERALSQRRAQKVDRGRRQAGLAQLPGAVGSCDPRPVSFDETLGTRIRDLLDERDDVDERRMFGGIAFLLTGRMFCGVVGDDVMVRVGPARYEPALAKPHVRAMDFTGKPFVGYVYVAPAGVKTKAALQQWVEWGIEFASTLPIKGAKKPAAKKPSAKKPSAKKPSAKKPSAKKPSAKKR
jgi:TfoX/Sxy family transcriptional regulator of competence genes